MEGVCVGCWLLNSLLSATSFLPSTVQGHCYLCHHVAACCMGIKTWVPEVGGGFPGVLIP